MNNPQAYIYPELHSHGAGRNPSRVWVGEITINGKLYRLRRKGLQDVCDWLREICAARGIDEDLKMLQQTRKNAIDKSDVEWRQIPEFPDLQCNQYGEFLYKGQPKPLRRVKGKETPYIYAGRYDNARTTYIAKCLVARVWIPGTEKGDIIQCIDGNAENISLSNLRNISLEMRKARSDMRDVPGIPYLKCTWYGLFEYFGKSRSVMRVLSRDGYKSRAYIRIKRTKDNIDAMRLVAMTWHEGFFPDCCVMPKDGDPWNIELSNIQVLSRKEYIELKSESRSELNRSDASWVLDENTRIAKELTMHADYITNRDIRPFNTYIADYLYGAIRGICANRLPNDCKAEQCAATVLSIIYERWVNCRKMVDILRYARYYVYMFANGKDITYIKSLPVSTFIKEAGLEEKWRSTHRKSIRDIMRYKISERERIRDTETQEKLKLLKQKYNA